MDGSYTCGERSITYKLVKLLCPAPETNIKKKKNSYKLKKSCLAKRFEKAKKKKNLKTFLCVIYSTYSLNRHLLNGMCVKICIRFRNKIIVPMLRSSQLGGIHESN